MLNMDHDPNESHGISNINFNSQAVSYATIEDVEKNLLGKHNVSLE